MRDGDAAIARKQRRKLGIQPGLMRLGRAEAAALLERRVRLSLGSELPEQAVGLVATAAATEQQPEAAIASGSSRHQAIAVPNEPWQGRSAGAQSPWPRSALSPGARPRTLLRGQRIDARNTQRRADSDGAGADDADGTRPLDGGDPRPLVELHPAGAADPARQADDIFARVELRHRPDR